MIKLPSVILISPPSHKAGEVELLRSFFEAGLTRYHLRKPSFSIEEMSELLEQIPSQYLQNIVVHRHPELLKDFAVGGYHYSSNESTQEVGISSSKSLHSLHELINLKQNLEYVFFGPIFRSISKKGYGPKISLNEVYSVLNKLASMEMSKTPKVYALGGIRKKKMIRLSEVGFSGVALLGSVWGSRDPLRALKEFLSMGAYFSK